MFESKKVKELERLVDQLKAENSKLAMAIDRYAATAMETSIDLSKKIAALEEKFILTQRAPCSKCGTPDMEEVSGPFVKIVMDAFERAKEKPKR